VEICAFDGQSWLRVAAALVEDDRAEARESMIDAYPSLRDRYAANDGNNVVYFLLDAAATFSNFTGAPTVVKF
jgi:uncharacterized pyridoxamine 5'-phosphate oxidase family protein